MITLTTEENRKPRSTQAEMEFRRLHVLERLQDGPKSLREIFDDTEWTYAQAVITLRKMKEDRDIEDIRKDGREVIYALYESDSHLAPQATRLIEKIATGDNSVRVVGVNFDDGVSFELKFPTGETFEAKLVA